ncbi:MAG: AbrB/MazE/SpoVT family DNA-binding domain-containing protein [Candidatus Diapherotrites archaeon]|nr:AbrB/MazE/SpoVT family DNA-binding domain-containing protein [Candidatus Diapherotrites archaeon]
MYESIAVIGERGQITIPKDIRELEGLKPKDKVIVKIEDNKIVVEKAVQRSQNDKLLIEYFSKYAQIEKKIADDWVQVSNESDAMLNDY